MIWLLEFLAVSGKAVAWVDTSGNLFANERLLARGAVRWGVSVKGDTVAFLRKSSQGVWVEVRTASGELLFYSDTFPKCGYPFWIGDSLAYQAQGRLWIWEKPGPKVEPVATFTASGKWIYWCGFDGKLWGLNLETGEKRLVFQAERKLFDPKAKGSKLLVSALGSKFYILKVPEGKVLGEFEGEAPSWSPDGKGVVFQRTQDDGHRILKSEIYELRVEDGTIRKIYGGHRVLLNPVYGPRGIWCDGGILPVLLSREESPH